MRAGIAIAVYINLKRKLFYYMFMSSQILVQGVAMMKLDNATQKW